MNLFKVDGDEWADSYGDYSSQQCCLYQQSQVSSGVVSSISGGSIVVNTAGGQRVLKVRRCSQIYQLEDGDERVFYKYESNFQNEQVIQMALLFSDEPAGSESRSSASDGVDLFSQESLCEREAFGICQECVFRAYFNRQRACVPVSHQCQEWEHFNGCTKCDAGY